MRSEPESLVVRCAGRQKRRNCAVVALLLISFCVFRADAQEAQPDTYAGFEGNNVAKVDVSAKPTYNVDAFRPLIQQKEGQPFSMKAIRDSVAALQKTGLFSKVQVSIKPEQAGLNILFILQPASYIGILDFPGATQTFSYTRLLQAVNIPEQTAFVDDLAAQGAQALLQFFQTNGYFEAKVTPEIQRDDAHRIVNIRFDCLRKEGRLAPEVQFNSPSYRLESGRADLNLQVDAGPLLSVRVIGARMFSARFRSWFRFMRRIL